MEFKSNGDVITEREEGPFDEYSIGVIKKGDDGYHRFHPIDGAVMICRHLKQIAAKLSELN